MSDTPYPAVEIRSGGELVAAPEIAALIAQLNRTIELLDLQIAPLISFPTLQTEPAAALRELQDMRLQLIAVITRIAFKASFVVRSS